MPKIRLDNLLVTRSLATDQDTAKRLIMSGKVSVNGQIADKPGNKYPDEAKIEVSGPKSPYASRGGEKLAAALAIFPITIDNQICLDLGASTGGFTSCLLLNGARLVYCVDVGKGILDWELRNDERVVVMEGVNARYLEAKKFDPTPTIIVADLSFISLAKILPNVVVKFDAINNIVCLVKPQFEAKRDEVEKGGVVRNPEVWERVLKDTATMFDEISFPVTGLIKSPLKGPAGNVEFLMWGNPNGGLDTNQRISEVVYEE